MSQPIIVVVDDQSSVCDTIKMMLKDMCAIQAFTSGEQAMKYLSTQHADLVLLDYDMPNMTGYEVLMHIRANNSKGSDLPIIFVTAVTNDRMEIEMLSRGASGYIRKPINMQELRSCVSEHLNRRGTVK